MAEREEQGLAKSALIPTSGNRFNYEGSPRLTIQQVPPPPLPPRSIETHGHAYTCTGVDARVHQDPFRPSPALSLSLCPRAEERREAKQRASFEKSGTTAIDHEAGNGARQWHGSAAASFVKPVPR